jgi:hypothetical protein
MAAAQLKRQKLAALAALKAGSGRNGGGGGAMPGRQPGLDPSFSLPLRPQPPAAPAVAVGAAPVRV